MEMEADPPLEFKCPITHELMVDPVICEDGYTYEREAIEKWLNNRGTSPMTNEPMGSRTNLVPNRALKDAIERYVNGGELPQAAISLPTNTAQADEDIRLVCRGTVGDNTIISVVPAAPGHRTPVHVSIVIDTSGSMDRMATKRSADNKLESFAYSLLDIVRHAAKTVAHILGPQDYVSIIEFSECGAVRLTPTRMDDAGRQVAERALDELQPTNSTNLGDGLRLGLEQCRMHSIRSHALQVVMMLTDGEPNEGNSADQVLASYHSAYPQSRNWPVYTYGFGYGPVETQLLSKISIMGGGTYTYVPDASFVGTAFVNATAAVLVTCATNLQLFVPDDVIIRNSGYKCDDEKGYGLGCVQYGQSRDIVLSLGGQSIRSVQIKYCRSTDQKVMSIDVLEDLEYSTDTRSLEFAYHDLRCKFVSAVTRAIESNNDGGVSAMKKLVKEMKQYDKLFPKLNDLCIDTEGQAVIAFANNEFERWGKHYLQSLRDAHNNQVCNNFKDPGVQHYGGSLFRSFVKTADQMYNLLPPPKASRTHGARVTSMSAMNCAAGPCVHENCLVLMADKSSKRARDIVSGDVVSTPSGTAVVWHVVQTECENNTQTFVQFSGGLMITPWHPVLIEPSRSSELCPRGAPDKAVWVHPADTGLPTVTVPCSHVYSFSLRPTPGQTCAVVVNGICVITLGHGITNDPIASHPFYGTDAVLRELEAVCDGQCRVVLRPNSVLKDPRTGLACSLGVPVCGKTPVTAEHDDKAEVAA